MTWQALMLPTVLFTSRLTSLRSAAPLASEQVDVNVVQVFRLTVPVAGVTAPNVGLAGACTVRSPWSVQPLTPAEFNLDVDNAPIGSGAPNREHATGLEATEKAMIQAALEKAGGNKTEAAKLLKISRRRLYSRMKAHEIPW